MAATSPKRRTTTERGLGWRHRQQRERLLAMHTDGTPCWWCGRAMFRDATKNFDGKPLEADHSEARSRGGRKADRLLCSTCNRQRQDGRHDDLRPAITGVWPPPGRGPAQTQEPRAAVFDWGPPQDTTT